LESRVDAFRQMDINRRTRVKIAVAESLVCCPRLCLLAVSDAGVEREKSAEPAIIAHMKLLKIRPKGRSSASAAVGFEWSRADLRAALQKKMKRYMALSKKHEATPRAKMRLSCMIVIMPLLMSDREPLVDDLVP
jgi:hypothetical protein